MRRRVLVVRDHGPGWPRPTSSTSSTASTGPPRPAADRVRPGTGHRGPGGARRGRAGQRAPRPRRRRPVPAGVPHGDRTPPLGVGLDLRPSTPGGTEDSTIHTVDVLIRIEGHDLPGRSCGPSPERPGGHHGIAVGVQRRNDPGELLGCVPAGGRGVRHLGAGGDPGHAPWRRPGAVHSGHRGAGSSTCPGGSSTDRPLRHVPAGQADARRHPRCRVDGGSGDRGPRRSAGSDRCQGEPGLCGGAPTADRVDGRPGLTTVTPADRGRATSSRPAGAPRRPARQGFGVRNPLVG